MRNVKLKQILEQLDQDSEQTSKQSDPLMKSSEEASKSKLADMLLAMSKDLRSGKVKGLDKKEIEYIQDLITKISTAAVQGSASATFVRLQKLLNTQIK